MKILSGPEGDGLLTNAEVLAWLKEKKFDIAKRDVPADDIRPCAAVGVLARDLRQYLESSPSGLQKVESTKKLFAALEKFKLTPPELIMIANIRPDAYAHLTPLIVDAHSRFDEDQLVEILQIVKTTLEKRKKDASNDEDKEEESGVDASTDNLAQASIQDDEIMSTALPTMPEVALSETVPQQSTLLANLPPADTDGDQSGNPNSSPAAPL